MLDIAIKKIENLIHVDLRYSLRGGFWLTIANAVAFASSVATGIAFTNLLSKSDYGYYSFAISALGMLTLFSLVGINTSIVRSVARGKDSTIFPAIRTRIRWGIVGSVAAVGASAYYFSLHNEALARIFLLLAIFAPFFDTFGIYDPFLQAKELFRLSTILNTINQLIVAVAVLAVLFFTRNYFLTLVAYFFVSTVTNLFLLVLIIRKLLSKKTFVDPTAISYGKHLSLTGLFGTAITFLDIPLVFHFLGATETAIYSIALLPTEQVKSIFKNLVDLAMPRFSRLNFPDIFFSLGRQSLLVFFLAVFVAIAYIVIAPFAFHTFFPSYPQSIFYSQILALSFLSFPLFLFISVLQSQKKTRKLYFLNIVSPIIQIVLLLILIPRLGIIGAVSAKVIGRLSNLMISYFLLFLQGRQQLLSLRGR